MLGLGLSLTTGGVATPAYVVLAKAFVSRVEADGGTVDSFACLKTDMAYLTSNPDAPAGYTVEWSSATVGSSAEFRINLVGGAGYTYTYAVTDTQATEVTGTGVMGGDIQAVTADLSTLVDGTVTLAVYLTGAGGDGNVVTDTANLVGYTGLLDTYSGAAAAYSLRLLDTSYTGDAIVVRRASDSATQSIGFVNNELDTATLESFCSGTNGFVTTWYDQSGSGNDATQTTSSAQPKIVSGGSTLLRGGKPSMQFDGVNDNFVTSQNNPFTFTGGVSMIHASYKNATSYKDYETILSANGNGGSKEKMALGYGNASVQNPKPTIVTDIWQPSGIQYDGTIGVNERHLIGFYISNWSTHRSTGLSNLRLNGSDLTTKTYGSTDPLTLGTGHIKIGVFLETLTPSFFGGEIQEVIAYASDKNSDRVGIETNINDHYSIY